jgi:hypothetical protein
MPTYIVIVEAHVGRIFRTKGHSPEDALNNVKLHGTTDHTDAIRHFWDQATVAEVEKR